MLLTAEEVLKAEDMRTEIIDVPGWGGEIKLSVMSGFARDRFEISCLGKNGGQNLTNIRARMLGACAVKDDGTPLFTEKQIVELGKKSGEVLDMLYEKAQKLNKISDDDIEELAKN